MEKGAFFDFEDADDLRSAMVYARKTIAQQEKADRVELVGITLIFLVDGETYTTAETIWSSSIKIKEHHQTERGKEVEPDAKV